MLPTLQIPPSNFSIRGPNRVRCRRYLVEMAQFSQIRVHGIVFPKLKGVSVVVRRETAPSLNCDRPITGSVGNGNETVERLRTEETD